MAPSKNRTFQDGFLNDIRRSSLYRGRVASTPPDCPAGLPILTSPRRFRRILKMVQKPEGTTQNVDHTYRKSLSELQGFAGKEKEIRTIRPRAMSYHYYFRSE